MKKLTLTLALALAAFIASAAPVSSETAQRLAQSFWKSLLAEPASQPADQLLAAQPRLLDSPFAHLYLFSFDASDGRSLGFVIMPADDCAYPILGFSLDRPITSGTELPAPVRFWLGQYEDEVAHYADHPSEVEPDVAAYVVRSWKQLADGSAPAPKTVVPTMLTTIWNQSPIYNTFCPNGAPVGCSATATAQVMKYWNHPRRGRNSHSYWSDYAGGIISADFGNTVYDWDHMPDELTYSSDSVQIVATATLCYHVGIGMEMEYDADGSGADVVGGGYGASARSALVDYFGYKSTMQGRYKRRYNDSQWDALLRQDLDARLPIIYCGFDRYAGHAFVFDGYNSTGHYHVNWGWGGYCDGYYAVGALNPVAGGVGANSTNAYNSSNQALFGIEPLPSLGLSVASLNLPRTDASASLQASGNYYSTASWTATTDASWLTITPSTGSGSAALTNVQVAATDNNTGHERHAVITLVQDGDTTRVPVCQLTCSDDEMCSLSVNMFSRSQHGWHGGQLTLSSVEGAVYGSASLHSGMECATIAIPVGPDSLVVTWHPGSADQDCGFYLENASGNICLQHNPNSLFPDGGRHLIANPCSTDGATGIHTFSLAAVSADTLCGTISGGASDQPFGSEQVITAFANPGYRFTGWDDGSRLNPRTLYLSSDTLLTALFEPLGTDTLAYATTDVSGKFAHSGAISFAVKFPKECLPGHREVVGLQFMTAVSGSYTISFYEDADGQPGSLTFTHTLSCPAGLVPYSMRNAPLPIKQSKDLWVVISTEAEDVLVPYDYWPGTDNGSLISFNNGATWISLSDEGFYGSWIIRAITTYDSTLYNLTLRSDDESMGTTEGSGSYLYGTRVPARAIPMPGYHFVRWSDQSTANPHNISMRSDLSVTAYFAEGEVSASAPDGLQPRAILQGLRLTLEQAEGLPVRLYDLQGRCLYATPAYHGQPIQLPCAGVYLLHTAASPAPQRLIAY